MPKIIFAAILSAAVIGAAQAAATQTTATQTTNVSLNEKAFLECLNQTDDNARLACYDRVAGTLQLGLSKTPVASDQTFASDQPGPSAQDVEDALAKSSIETPTKIGAAPALKPKPEDSFGLSQRQQAQKGSIKEITNIQSKVVEVGLLPRGGIKITLENGQVWRQIDSDNTRLQVRAGKEYVAIVKKGALGSHKLKLNNSKRAIRVRRVK